MTTDNHSPKPLRVRKVIYYILFIPSMVIASLLMVTLGMLMPFRLRMELTTLWNYLVSEPLLRWFTGIRVEVEGLENIPKEVFVAVSNHQSEWETYYLGRRLRPVSMVIKRELLSIPFFGWAMRAARHIPIDRSRKHNSIDQIVRQGRERLCEGINVMIFPESTRANPGEIRRYSRTAAKLAIDQGVPLLPMVHNAGEHWSNRGVMRPGTIRLRIGQPLKSTGRSAAELTDQVMQWSLDNFRELSPQSKS